MLQEKMEVIVFTLVTLILIVLLKWLLTTPKVKKNRPPSPRGIPILGNLLQLGVLPHHPIHSLSQKYGPIMLLRFGKIPTIVISSAEGAKEIMKTHDLVFADRPRSSVADRLLYNSRDISVAPYGEYWRQLKSISVVQLLSNKKVQDFRPIREEEIAQMVKNIQDSVSSSNPVNLSEMFLAFTNDVVCRSAFGRKYGEGLEGKKFMDLLSEFVQLLGSTYLGAFVPWLEWINRFNGFDARIDRVAKGIDRFLENIIEERLRNGFDEKEGEDFLNILLRIYKDTESEVSMERDSLKAIILVCYFGKILMQEHPTWSSMPRPCSPSATSISTSLLKGLREALYATPDLRDPAWRGHAFLIQLLLSILIIYVIVGYAPFGYFYYPT